jgi:hypothetical protein
MKVRTVILINICFLLASLLIAEETTMITGREKRDQAITTYWDDDWYAFTLPRMNDVLVASKKFSFDIGEGREWEVDLDIYYPPDFNFTSKLPAVFISRQNSHWKSDISFGQLIAASGLIAIIPNISSGRDFGETIAYCLKNAKDFGINKKYIGIWGGGHPANDAFDAALDKSQKYHKNIKCAVFEAAVLRPTFDKGNMSNDIPLLFITGSLDTIYARPTHTFFLEIVEEMNIPLDYILYEGAGHMWYKDDTDEARDFIQKELDFLKSHLL